MDGKIKREHLIRNAFLYIRQSTLRQVFENTESTKRQYALKEKLINMGWDESRIEIIDSDLGQSGSGSDERHGFQHLVSEVSLGRAGIIAGIEVSRLSRSSSDWNRLLQIAAISDTLIMDEDGLYNVNDFNDRLLLGLKGTLSEAELHYLKARMRGGLLNKAKRGELRRSLSIGYVYDENGQIVKDPDAQVQEAVTLLFNTFKRIGSARGLVREYEKQGFLFPHREHKGFKPGELSWKKLTYPRVYEIMSNPLYSGIYAYGMEQIQHTAYGAKIKTMPKELYHAWLPGSHPAYISEAQFEENKRQLAKNSRPKPEIGHSGAVREGSALLQGIAICGICGRMMAIRYSESANETQPVYLCHDNNVKLCGPRCQTVNGGNIDRAIERLLLEVINPMTTDAAVSIQHEIAERSEEVLRLYSQQMERARYEMGLAKRRYLGVDPDNRLVAAELEHEWDKRINEYESAKVAYEQKCEDEACIMDEKLRRALEQLVVDFPKIWSDPQTSRKEKKRVVRLILDDVTITANPSTVVLGVRFKSGSTRVLEIPNIRRNLEMVDMEMAAVTEIKAMLPLGAGNQEIADILNEKGLKSGFAGKPFVNDTVNWLIRKYGLTDVRRTIAEADGWLTGREKRAELKVAFSTLKKMRENGELVFRVCNRNGTAYLYKPQDPVSV